MFWYYLATSPFVKKVIRNLVSNALKFTPNGGKVTVNLDWLPDQNGEISEDIFPPSQSSRNFGWFMVTVVDSGAGISKVSACRCSVCLYLLPVHLLCRRTRTNCSHKLFSLLLASCKVVVARDLVYTVRTMIYFYAKANIVFVCARVCVVSKGIVEGHRGEVSVHSEGEGMGCTFTLKLPSFTTGEDQFSGSSSEVDQIQCMGDHVSAEILHARTEEMTENRNTSSIVHSQTSHSVKSPTKEIIPEEFKNYFEFNSFSEISETSINSIGITSEISNGNFVKSKSNESGKFRILIVDDVESNRKMMCRLLRSRCCEFIQASDGLEAVNKVAEMISHDSTPFDIISMDYQMPVMDGPEAARKIRDMGYTGLMLGVTGNALGEDIRYFKEHGVDDVLTKPINISQFDAITSKFYGGQSM